MRSLQNKRVLLGITGGIAAYKSPDVVRRLRDAGAEVRVVMTVAAQEFITPMTLQAVSGQRVHSDLLDSEAEAAMGHIELARWADIVVVAPVTADALARFSQGRADDLLSTQLRASDAPVLLAPAMNQAMWRDGATQQNIERLRQLGYHFVGPEEGAQACGDTGVGRMSEAATITAAAARLFHSEVLAGRQVVITAGPTREAIDPVRYLSNYSSGKMGFALAEAAAEAGAAVTLIAGPVDLPTPPRVQREDVLSAAEMLAAVEQRLPDCEIFIAAAAVADFRPVAATEQKLKKRHGVEQMTLDLVKNPDILASAARSVRYSVGFAAETEQLLPYAAEKMARKGVNMMIANDVSRSDIGFSSDINEVTVLQGESVLPLEKGSKSQLARRLIRLIADALPAV